MMGTIKRILFTQESLLNGILSEEAYPNFLNKSVLRYIRLNFQQLVVPETICTRVLVNDENAIYLHWTTAILKTLRINDPHGHRDGYVEIMRYARLAETVRIFIEDIVRRRGAHFEDIGIVNTDPESVSVNKPVNFDKTLVFPPMVAKDLLVSCGSDNNIDRPLQLPEGVAIGFSISAFAHLFACTIMTNSLTHRVTT